MYFSKPYLFDSREALIAYLMGVDLRSEPIPAEYDDAVVYFTPFFLGGREYWLPSKVLKGCSPLAFGGETLLKSLNASEAYRTLMEAWRDFLESARTDDALLKQLLYRSSQTNFHGINVIWKRPRNTLGLTIRLQNTHFPVKGQPNYRYTYTASTYTYDREEFLEGMAQAIALRRYWRLVQEGHLEYPADIEAAPEKYRPVAIPCWSKLDAIEEKLFSGAKSHNPSLPFVTQNPAHQVSVSFSLKDGIRTNDLFQFRSVTTINGRHEGTQAAAFSELYPAMLKQWLLLAGESLGTAYSEDEIEAQLGRLRIRIQESLMRYADIADIKSHIEGLSTSPSPLTRFVVRDDICRGWLCSVPRPDGSYMQFSVPDAAESPSYSFAITIAVVSKIVRTLSVSLKDQPAPEKGARNKLRFFPYEIADTGSCSSLRYASYKALRIPFRSISALSFPLTDKSAEILAHYLRMFFLIKYDHAVPKRFETLQELCEYPFLDGRKAVFQKDWVAMAKFLLSKDAPRASDEPLSSGIIGLHMVTNKRQKTVGITRKPGRSAAIYQVPMESKESFNRAYLHALAVGRMTKDQKISNDKEIRDLLENPDLVPDCYDFGVLPNPALYAQLRSKLCLEDESR